MIKARALKPGDTIGVISPSWGGAGLYPHRCEAAQGFYLARPMSAAALTEILESRRPGSEIADERAAG